MKNRTINGNTSRIANLLKNGMSSISILIAVILLSVLWSILSPYFFTMSNLVNIGTYISSTGIIAAGVTVAMLIGGLDLSHMAIMALSGTIMGVLYQAGWPPVAFILAAVVVGGLCGAVNAFIITFMKINPIITTMGTQLVFRALAFLITDGKNITFYDPLVKAIGSTRIAGLPLMLLIMLAVCILISFILKNTQIGRNVYSVGGSEAASFLSGISIVKVKFFAYMLCGCCAGFASLLYIAQASNAMPNAGTGSEMNTIGATVLGGISLSGGKGKIGSTLLGVLLLSLITNGMTLLSIDPYIQMLIRGAILIIAVFMDTLKNQVK